ncbi:MAG: hypothetical protein U9Q07_01040, partial [Planctomycetota bacterium]|nr:hypothetical protein [Planctomycetota bacterium]
VNTDLDGIATLAAATWIKLGIRYRHQPRLLEWYVDGAKVASITRTALDNALFPDGADDFMQPTVGIKIGSAAGAVTLDLDWWACGQVM